MPTTGVLIDEKMAAEVTAAGLDIIGISLDSFNPEVHDSMRGMVGAHQRALKALAHLSRASIKVYILAIISNKNLHEIMNLAEWAIGHKHIYGITFQAISQPFNTPYDSQWFSTPEYSGLWPKDKEIVVDVLGRLIVLKRQGAKITNPIAQLNAFKQYFAHPRQGLQKECSIGNYYMNINHLGDVMLCANKRKIGKIIDADVRAIWQSKEADLVREEIGQCKRNCHHRINCCYRE